MAEILECIAAALWISLNIYAWLKIRHVTKRLENCIDESNTILKQYEAHLETSE